MRHLLFPLLLCGAAAASEKLPANTWVKVNEKGGGVRRGSAVVWLEKEGRFLVLGGVSGNQKLGIARPYDVQTFDHAAGKWQEVKPEGLKLDDRKASKDGLLTGGAEGQGPLRLNPRFAVRSRSADDRARRCVYLCQAGNPKAPGELVIARYDVDARKWQVVSRAKPPAKANGALPGEYGGTVVFMEAAAMVLDPVNDELLFLGGRTGNAPGGFVGHWAFSLSQKDWRRLAPPADSPLVRLREGCLSARSAVRGALAAARNAFYAALPPEKRRAACEGSLAGQLAGAIDALRTAAEAVARTKLAGWRAEAVAGGLTGLAKATRHLAEARKRLRRGDVDGESLRHLFDAAWGVDEAADLLRDLPGERMHAAAAYDPARQAVVLFGGDHGDYLLSDTWLYDCRGRSWRRVFPPRSPEPRRAAGALVRLPDSKRLALVGGETYVAKFMYFRRRPRLLHDVWAFDAADGKWSVLAAGDANSPGPALTCQRAAGRGDVLLGLASAGRWPSQWDGTTWLMRLAGGGDTALAAKIGVPPGKRTYFTVVKEYDPCWYDGAAGGETERVATWLARLKPNTWTRVPLAPRPAPRRDWGTAAFDPDRDQFYHWTGGHMADPASIVSTYHVAAGRWSIPYVAEYFGKGIGFNGRPDCMNHTYLNYAYDVLSKKLVCTSLGGTCVYDPDRREFAPRIDQPFRQHPYFTKTVGTPRGVVCWDRGYFGLLDVPHRRWKKLPVTGKLPRVVHGDENAVTYDARRDVLWLLAADGYQKPNGQVWRYEMRTGVVRAMDPAGMKAVGMKVRPRESVYLPKQDLVLHNAFAENRQIAYEPARNRWVTLPIAKAHKDLGGVSIGLMYDPKRDLVWAMAAGQRMYVLSINAETTAISGPAEQ